MHDGATMFMHEYEHKLPEVIYGPHIKYSGFLISSWMIMIFYTLK